MPQGPATENTIELMGNVQDSMQSAVLGNLVINIIMSGSLQYLWGMINALQITFHLPGMQINLPGNAAAVYSVLN